MAARNPRSKTRERILDEAFELFLDVGVQGATITDIERRVGLTPGRGSFYRHFRSKEELVTAVVAHEISRRMSEVRAARAMLVVPDDPREAMIAEAEQVLLDIQRFNSLFHLILTDGDRVPLLRESVLAALHDSSLLGEWIDDPKRFIVLTSLMGYHSFAAANPDTFTPERERRFIASLVDAAPFARPPLPEAD